MSDEQAMYDEPFADLGEADGLDAPVSALELSDAERLADVLDRIDAGRAADLDPREDPTLTALTAAAGQLRESVGGAASTPRFASYSARSREYVLQRIERERAAKAAASAPARPARGGGIPFLRWNVLSPIASAAAAAVAVLAFVVLTDDGATAPAPAQVASVETPAAAPATPEAATPAATATEQATPVVRRVVHPSGEVADERLADLITSAERPAVAAAAAAEPDADASETAGMIAPASDVPPRQVSIAAPAPSTPSTPRTLPEQLDHIDTLLSDLTVSVQREEPAPGWLLRAITESIAAVAYQIESRPDEVTHAQVIAYIHAAADGRFLLAAAVADEADEAALNAARRVAQDGVVVAGWYFKYR